MNTNFRETARERLLAYIETMDISADNRLPAEDRLCEIVQASRITVRAVLDELIAEGRVIRRRGMRCYVNPEYARIKAVLYPYVSIEMNIRAIGHTPHARNMRTQVVEADAEIAGALNIAVGAEVVRSAHLFYADDVFCVLCYDYLDAALLTREDITRLNVETSVIFRLLYEKTGRKMAWDLLELGISDTGSVPQLARYAGLPEGQQKAYLKTNATIYDDNNRPLFFSTAYYDPEFFTFGMVRKRRYDFDDFLSEALPADADGGGCP